MRIEEIVQGNRAMLDPSMQARIYYHGSDTTVKAQHILRDGIQPGNTSHARGSLTPVSGAIYLTIDLKYAVIYALGGAVAGQSDAAEWIIKQTGDRYGYLFVVPGALLVNHVQPDEDYVGQFLDWFSFNDPKTKQVRFYRERPGADAELNQIWDFISSVITPQQRHRIFQGEYAAYASGGKRALKTMPAWMKLKLIKLGWHLAHHGPVRPSECWRIDKQHCGEIDENDAHNFFEIAERIGDK
jgi:hypothetical protein